MTLCVLTLRNFSVSVVTKHHVWYNEFNHFNWFNLIYLHKKKCIKLKTFFVLNIEFFFLFTTLLLQICMVQPKFHLSGFYQTWFTCTSWWFIVGFSWNADQVLGPAKVYPQYGDIRGAWSPGDKNDSEFIEVSVLFNFTTMAYSKILIKNKFRLYSFLTTNFCQNVFFFKVLTIHFRNHKQNILRFANKILVYLFYLSVDKGKTNIFLFIEPHTHLHVGFELDHLLNMLPNFW